MSALCGCVLAWISLYVLSVPAHSGANVAIMLLFAALNINQPSVLSIAAFRQFKYNKEASTYDVRTEGGGSGRGSRNAASLRTNSTL